jgi:hypothetical protein
MKVKIEISPNAADAAFEEISLFTLISTVINR